jgi:hypothetical protein
MVQRLYDDQTIIRYLLEDLPEEEMAKVEENYFSNNDFLEYTEMVEGKLIDDYLQKKLCSADEEKFERRYLAFARKRKEVEFTKWLMAAVALENKTSDESRG